MQTVDDVMSISMILRSGGVIGPVSFVLLPTLHTEASMQARAVSQYVHKFVPAVRRRF